MKKKLLTFILVLSLLFIGLDIVSASTSSPTDGYVSNFYNDYPIISEVHDNYSSIISNVIDYYNTNLLSDYSNYVIDIRSDSSFYYIDLHALNHSEIQALQLSSNSNIPQLAINKTGNVSHKLYRATIQKSDSSISYSLHDSYDTTYNKLLYSSKIPLIFVDSSSCLNTTYPCFNSLTIPTYSDINLDIAYSQFDILNGDSIPTYETLISGSSPVGYTTVNLSSYNYIILSLKDYNQSPFNTPIYTEGSLCITPVYDYGMRQKNEYFPGYQVQGCTETYSTLTPVNVYILQSDLDNNSVYYIKQQPNIPTTLKIPESIFNITYISTSSEQPQVIINNKSYPSLKYNDLTDTANISTDTGYISGRVCSLGDVNCQGQQMGMDIADLFTHPLTLLQSIWTSIIGVFGIIVTFMSVLPPTLQAFMYTSFMLGIVLGIIKIII